MEVTKVWFNERRMKLNSHPTFGFKSRKRFRIKYFECVRDFNRWLNLFTFSIYNFYFKWAWPTVVKLGYGKAKSTSDFLFDKVWPHTFFLVYSIWLLVYKVTVVFSFWWLDKFVQEIGLTVDVICYYSVVMKWMIESLIWKIN